MALHYIFGASGAGKSYTLYREIKQEAERNPHKKYLVIVPEQFTLQTQRAFVTMEGQTAGILNIDVLSFLRLAYRVFEQTGELNRVVLEDTGKSMIVKKVAMQCASKLEVFGRNVQKNGFIDEIKSVISEFYQYGIGKEELDRMCEAAKNRPGLTKKLHDLAILYEGFEDFLAERYITTEGILGVLADRVPQSELIAGSTICLDGFTGFTPSQYRLIGTLMKHAAEIYLTVTMPPEYVFRKLQEHELFYLSSHTVQWMDKLAAWNGQEIAEAVCLQGAGRYHATESLTFLSEQLFRPGKCCYKEKQDSIRIFSHRNLREEVIFTVTEIYRLVRQNGYRYRDIAVVTADIESYADTLDEEFKRAGLPCFIDRKKKILNNPVVEFLFAVLSVAEQDFSSDTVLRYLKSPLSGFTDEEADLFENYITALGIRHFSSYQKEWTRKYRSAYDCPLERLNQLRERFVMQWQEYVKKMREEHLTVKERMKELLNFLIARNTWQYLEQCAQDWQTTEPLRAREYGQLWRMLLELFDRVVGMLGDDEISLKELREILETGFAEAKVGLVPPGVDTILVGDMERTRLSDIRVLFFLGMNEGVVPKQSVSGGVLSQQDRLLFADAGIELAPNRRQNAYLSEFYLYLNLTKPSEKLYLSWRRLDSAGKTMLPSYLLGRVQGLFAELLTETISEENLGKCMGTDAGFRTFIAGISKHIARSEQLPAYYPELYHAYMSGIFTPMLPKELLACAAYYRKPEQALSLDNATGLYGSTLFGSVTRLEQYASCAFAHFLRYGLRLEERAEYEVRMPDIGTIYHAALQYFSASMKENGCRWHDGLSQQTGLLLKQAVERAVSENTSGIFAGSNRNAALLLRMERMLSRTVTTVQKQIAAGDFEPAVFEHTFEHADRFLCLTGKIDRIDLCEEDGKTYLRVIDYKSGMTAFSLEKLYYGLQLQLAVYLNAALDWAKENGMGDAMPAGMLYYRIQDPVVEKEKNVQTELARTLRMNGVVNSQTEALMHQDHAFCGDEGRLAAGVTSNVIPAGTTKAGELSKNSMTAATKQMKSLTKYVGERLYDEAQKIIQGDVDPAPYRKGMESACMYCSYQNACGFDCRMEGYRYRDLTKKSADEIWQEIER